MQHKVFKLSAEIPKISFYSPEETWISVQLQLDNGLIYYLLLKTRNSQKSQNQCSHKWTHY